MGSMCGSEAQGELRARTDRFRSHLPKIVAEVKETGLLSNHGSVKVMSQEWNSGTQQHLRQRK